MIRRKEDRALTVKKMFDGAGTVKLHHILQSDGELYGKGRVFSHVSLEPGCEVGYHVHHGDGETYYVLSGVGDYNDNGNIVKIYPGDVTFVDDGEGHGVVNTGTEPLEMIALILYK